MIYSKEMLRQMISDTVLIELMNNKDINYSQSYIEAMKECVWKGFQAGVEYTKKQFETQIDDQPF